MIAWYHFEKLLIKLNNVCAVLGMQLKLLNIFYRTR